MSDRYKAYMKIFAEVIQKLLQCNKCRGYRGITASHLDRSMQASDLLINKSQYWVCVFFVAYIVLRLFQTDNGQFERLDLHVFVRANLRVIRRVIIAGLCSH